MGQNKQFTAQLCPALQAFMDEPCGCFFMTAPSPVAQPTSWMVSTPTGGSWGLAPPSPGKPPAPLPVPVPAPISAPIPASVPAPIPSPVAVGWTQPAPTGPNISWGSPKKVAKAVDCGLALKCTNHWTGQAGYFMHGFSTWGCFDSCRPISVDSSSMTCGLCE